MTFGTGMPDMMGMHYLDDDNTNNSNADSNINTNSSSKHNRPRTNCPGPYDQPTESMDPDVIFGIDFDINLQSSKKSKQPNEKNDTDIVSTPKVCLQTSLLEIPKLVPKRSSHSRINSQKSSPYSRKCTFNSSPLSSNHNDTNNASISYGEIAKVLFPISQ